MELKIAANKFVLGNLYVEDLPSVAQNALEDGYDSPTLCRLAASRGSDGEQLRKLFVEALDELGLSIPKATDAGLSSARAIAKEVLDGNITPYAGAKQIWGQVYTRFPELGQLRVFVGLASEYEDDENHRECYSRQIIEECIALTSE